MQGLKHIRIFYLLQPVSKRLGNRFKTVLQNFLDPFFDLLFPNMIRARGDIS